MLPKASSLSDRRLCERIPVLQTSHFYPCSSGRGNSIAVGVIVILQFGFAICVENIWLVSLQKSNNFRLCCGRLFLRKFKLISEKF